jgi:hypothetical protein
MSKKVTLNTEIAGVEVLSDSAKGQIAEMVARWLWERLSNRNSVVTPHTSSEEEEHECPE